MLYHCSCYCLYRYVLPRHTACNSCAGSYLLLLLMVYSSCAMPVRRYALMVYSSYGMRRAVHCPDRAMCYTISLVGLTAWQQWADGMLCRRYPYLQYLLFRRMALTPCRRYPYLQYLLFRRMAGTPMVCLLFRMALQHCSTGHCLDGIMVSHTPAVGYLYALQSAGAATPLPYTLLSCYTG